MNTQRKTEFSYAFRQTIPVMLGYLFLGIAFGLMLQEGGYSFLWAFLISTVVYAGSMQFVLVTFLTGGVSLITAAVMTLLINGRHLFYGISFVEKFRKAGWRFPYLVFALTDETYSVLCGVKVFGGMDEGRVYFWISLLDQCYWIAGSVIGALAGRYIAFDSTGIDFSMTALFIVIMVEQWQGAAKHFPAVLGVVSAVIWLIILGPDRFILPALCTCVVVLLLANGKERNWTQEESGKEGGSRL